MVASRRNVFGPNGRAFVLSANVSEKLTIVNGFFVSHGKGVSHL